MPSVSDVAFYRIFVTFSAFLGLVPFSKVETNRLIYTYKSFFGVWCLIIKCGTILAVLFVVPLILLAQVKLPCEFTPVGNNVELFIYIFNALLFLSTYVVTLRFVPHTIQLYNRLLDYNKTYTFTCLYNLAEVIQKCLLLAVILIEPLSSIILVLGRLDYLEKRGIPYNRFQVVDLDISPTGLKIVFTLWVFLTQFPIVYSLSSIILFSHMVQNRMFQIRQTLTDMSRMFPKIVPNERSLDALCFNYNTQDILAQMQDLQETFSVLKKSIELLLVIFISHATVLLTLYTFIARIAISMQEFNIATIPYSLVVAIILLATKTISLTTCGEIFINEVSCMLESYNNTFDKYFISRFF